MFIKSLRQTKRVSLHDCMSYDQKMKFPINQLRQSHVYNMNPERQSDSMKKNLKTLFKLRFDNLKQICTNNNKSIKKQQLITFENDYLKSLSYKNKHIISQDQRKQSIKQKIKDKIKEQITNLNRNYDNLSSSLRQIKPKLQILLKDQNKKVSIKGNSIPRQLKISLSQKINDTSKINYYRKNIQITSKRSNNQQSHHRLMTSNPISPISMFKKGRRSLSNAIKIHPAQSKKINVRNIHSALGQFTKNQNNSNNQLQIQPWDFTEEY